MDWEPEARAAGWLPPEEVQAKLWRARNMHGGRCRWCRAARINGPDTEQWFRWHSEPQPHVMHCRFYAGPVTHASAGTVHWTGFCYRVSCACGESFEQFDGDGNRQACPDVALTHREPRVPDLTAM